MVTNQLKHILVAIFAMLFMCSLTFAANELSLRITSDSNHFVDVNDLTVPNEMNWAYNTPITRQVQIVAKFDNVGDDTINRQLIVSIPEGYRILQYSAKPDTPNITSVDKLAISALDDKKIDSVYLMASDGTSTWGTPLTGFGGATPPRPYDGQIIYNMNELCDQIVITITLMLDPVYMPRSTSTTSMPPIAVDLLVDDVVLLTESVVNKVSGVAALGLASTGTKELRHTAYDERNSDGVGGGATGQFNLPTLIGNDGSGEMVLDFTTGHRINAAVFADEIVYTLTYPEGVTFKGFTDDITGTGRVFDTAFDASGISTPNSNLTVVHNELTRTVTFTYNDVYSNVQWITCHWEFAEDYRLVDDDKVQWGSQFIFGGTVKVTPFLAGDNPDTITTANSAITLTVPRPYDPWTPAEPSLRNGNAGANWTRRNLNDAFTSGGNYPYDYALGGFQFVNTYRAENLTYTFEFDANLAVRGIILPGYSDNNYTSMIFTTNKRTITKTEGFKTGTVTAGHCTTFDSAWIGLADDEYILGLVAEQDSLQGGTNGVTQPNRNYQPNNTYDSIIYLGRFQNGQTGDAKLKINFTETFNGTEKELSAVNRTNIGWTSVTNPTMTFNRPGVGSAIEGVGHSVYPGATMRFSTTITTNVGISTNNDIVDPIVYICLPAGIELATDSVKATSIAGKSTSSTDSFLLRLVSEETKDIGGNEWKVYGFTSVDKMDMIAKSNHNMSSTFQQAGYNQIKVDFLAVVNSSCKTYTDMRPQQFILWDLGITAAASGNYVNDTNNIAKKGTTYRLLALSNTWELHVVRKSELYVGLGIRAKGTPQWYEYNGLESSIAPVAIDRAVEVSFKYENRDVSCYYPGTEIYLPIPKAGEGYSNYFNNKSTLNAVNNESNPSMQTVPEWNSYLTGPLPALAGFDTFYTINGTFDVRLGSPYDTNTWTPDDSYTWVAAAAISDWSKVTMVKFIANDIVDANEGDEIVFELNIDAGTNYGLQNSWRAFYKGWFSELDAGAGSWMYSNIIAGETSVPGSKGMLFEDKNVTGHKDGATEDFDNSDGKITALLTGTKIGDPSTAVIPPLYLTMNADGSFEMLYHSDGSQYFLKSGVYTISFFNNTGLEYGFAPNTPGNASSYASNNWYMNIAQADILEDHSRATYTFTLNADVATDEAPSIGVSLLESPVVTYIPGEGASFVQKEEYVFYGRSPVDNPNNDIANVITGYNPDTMMWTLDKEVIVNASGSELAVIVPAGYPITTAQLRRVRVEEDLQVTADFTLYEIDITYIIQGRTEYTNQNASRTVADKVDVVTYGDVIDYAPNPIPRLTGHIFAGWNTEADGSGVDWEFGDRGTPATIDNDVDLTNITLTLYAMWEVNMPYSVSVIGSYAANDGAGYYLPGAEVTIDAGSRSGFTFFGWSAPDGIDLVELSGTVAKFIMGDFNVSIVANWQSSGSNTTPPTPPAEVAPTLPAPPAGRR